LISGTSQRAGNAVRACPWTSELPVLAQCFILLAHALRTFLAGPSLKMGGFAAEIGRSTGISSSFPGRNLHAHCDALPKYILQIAANRSTCHHLSPKSAAASWSSTKTQNSNLLI